MKNVRMLSANRLGRGLPSLIALLLQAYALPALAQTTFDVYEIAHHSEFRDELPRSSLAVPGRPLTLPQHTAQLYAGMSPTLTKDNAFDAWTMPMGASLGLLRTFEIGIDTGWELKPWKTEYLVQTARLYGRTLVLENQLAAELALYLPTAFTSLTAAEMLLPTRIKVDRLEIIGQGKLYYGNGVDVSAIEAGASASVYYSITDRTFVAIDSGFVFTTADAPVTGRNANFVLPFGVGAGAKLTDDTFVKASFLFRDLMSEESATGDWNGLDSRTVTVVLVQAFDLSPSNTERRTASERQAEEHAAKANAEKR